MTLLRDSRDLLMVLASSRVSPQALVLSTCQKGGGGGEMGGGGGRRGKGGGGGGGGESRKTIFYRSHSGSSDMYIYMCFTCLELWLLS